MVLRRDFVVVIRLFFRLVISCVWEEFLVSVFRFDLWRLKLVMCENLCICCER